VSNEDKRRRRDGSTAQLSVADLIARREAETQPIPRITDEETVRFPAANLSGRELHITELLRREGRAGEEERGGGLSVPKLVAMASGGVVLAGTVAFTATNLLSSPDERPLAEVRFDTRPAARSTNTLGYDLATTMQQQAPEQAADRTEPAAAGPTTAAQQRPRATQRPAPVAQQPAPPPAAEPAPTTEQPPSTTTAPPAPAPPAPPSAPPSAPPTTTTPPTTQAPPPSSTPVAPPTSDSPPPSSTPALPSVPPLLDPGGVLAPLGGFDFFAPA